jgi:hypothetical protein
MPKPIEGALFRILGMLGGLMCAAAASLVALYLCKVFGWPMLGFALAAVVSVVGFALLGLLCHRYFMWFFFAPLIAQTWSGAGADRALRDWRESVALASLVFGLIGLAIGALGKFHAAFAIGAVLFLGFAIFGPKVFREREQRIG